VDDTLPEGIPELTAVRELLAAHVPGVGPLRACMLSGGRSNLTYSLTDGAGRWVLRRPPLGHVLATAHDMGREYRVMHALAPTPVPVPRTILEHRDPDLLGAPFYVMELVEGVVYRDAGDYRHLDADARRRLGHAFVDALAALHLVDPAEVGLADFGRAEGYLARQVRGPATCPASTPSPRGWPTTCRPRSGRRSCTATTGWTT